MKNILAVIGLLVVVGTIGFIAVGNKPDSAIQVNITPTSTIATKEIIVTPQPVSYSASFAIFTNSIFRVFTASMYHNQSDDVYIQADNPNIIQIKKNGTTWDDFFKTLPFKLTKECLTTGTGETFCTNNNRRLRFYLNGRETPNALEEQIKKGDQLLVTYGNENEQEIQAQLQRIHIIK